MLGGPNNYQYTANPLQWIDPLGLCKDSCDSSSSPAGTAIINQHKPTSDNPFGHFTIEVKRGDQSRHTHQLMTGPPEDPGASTSIFDANEYEPSQPLLQSVEVPLTNPDKAMAYQDSILMEELGPYSKKTNSCVDHVCNVLREGGEPVKSGALKQYKYLKDLGF